MMRHLSNVALGASVVVVAGLLSFMVWDSSAEPAPPAVFSRVWWAGWWPVVVFAASAVCGGFVARRVGAIGLAAASTLALVASALLDPAIAQGVSTLLVFGAGATASGFVGTPSPRRPSHAALSVGLLLCLVAAGLAVVPTPVLTRLASARWSEERRVHGGRGFAEGQRDLHGRWARGELDDIEALLDASVTLSRRDEGPRCQAAGVAAELAFAAGCALDDAARASLLERCVALACPLEAYYTHGQPLRRHCELLLAADPDSLDLDSAAGRHTIQDALVVTGSTVIITVDGLAAGHRWPIPDNPYARPSVELRVDADTPYSTFTDALLEVYHTPAARIALPLGARPCAVPLRFERVLDGASKRWFRLTLEPNGTVTDPDGRPYPIDRIGTRLSRAYLTPDDAISLSAPADTPFGELHDALRAIFHWKRVHPGVGFDFAEPHTSGQS